MKFSELEKILKNDGWTLKNIRGSHHHYVHPIKPGKVTVPFHSKSGDLKPKTVNSILKQAGLMQ